MTRIEQINVEMDKLNEKIKAIKPKTGKRNNRKILFTIEDMRECWDEALSYNSKKFHEWISEYKSIKNIK